MLFRSGFVRCGRGLTLPSSGLAPAGRFRPSFHSRPYAPCLREPLKSNVRPHETPIQSVVMLGVVGHELAASDNQSVDRSASWIVRRLLVCASAKFPTIGCEEQNDCRVYAGGGKCGKRFARPPKQKLSSFRGAGE